MIGYTSGTTGLPKGAIWTNYAFLCMIFIPDFVLNSNKNNSITVGCHYPFSHLSGIYLLTKFAVMGNPIVIIDFNTNEDLFKAIATYKLSYIGVNLSLGHQLLDDNITSKYDLRSLKIMGTGGTPFPSHLVQPIIDKFNLQSFTHTYVMTECIPITLNTDQVYIPGSCGHLAPDTQLKVRDTNTGHCLGPNQLGELCVKSNAMFSGYLNNTKATDETIDLNGWLYTGDIGYYDESGRIFLTDRINELIKYQSHSIAPAEIEGVLLTHNSIEDAAVVGVPHHIDNQWLRAYVVVKNNKQLTEKDVLDYVADNMGSRKQLRDGVVFVDQIKKTLIGKIDRKYYRQLV